MLILKLKDNKMEFSFIDYFSKNKIHSECFTLEDAEQIAIDLLTIIKNIKQVKIMKKKMTVAKVEKDLKKHEHKDEKMERALKMEIKKKKK